MIGLFYAPEALQKQMEINHHSFILCYDNETPVGFASYSDTGEGNFKLHKLYVLPVCQGKGAGKFMIDHIVLDIKNKGGVALILNVNRFNAAAIAFYKKVGFRLVVNEDIDIGDGYFMNDHIFGLAV